ncbi:hypothetical protein KIW84_021547 [Lathyrus oleraceus]|uniref:Neprosin PEP catalytic domain-containing protein n=1 Tax=Pisum sativum TaxID=3888 RepID=A0A9D5BA23_PEA|nr:hypothetical protein KIW84_021547 [Pisum sativum]
MMAQTSEKGEHVTGYMQSEMSESFVGTGPQGTMCAKNNVKKIEMESERTSAPTHLKNETDVYDENISDERSYSQLGWMKLLIIAYNVTYDVMTLYYDNLNTAAMSKNHIQHSWTKFLICCQLSIRKFVEEKIIVPKLEIQLADKGAKNLDEFGDIVDCIDINNQPAFSHPLLMNHKLQYAEVISNAERDESYEEVYGTTSVYDVSVTNNQSTSAVMYIRNGPDSTNYIGMGWHTDNFKNTGCFNLQCSGFVQTSKNNYLGGRFVNTSVIDGRIIEMTISITQDSETKNWWVTNENEMIGYFPASLFSNNMPFLQVGWGGRTSNPQGGPSPPMGSGRFPIDDKYDHASYFLDIKFRYHSTNTSPENSLMQVVSDKPNCFYAKYFDRNFPDIGYSLLFGGPGGNCDD